MGPLDDLVAPKFNDLNVNGFRVINPKIRITWMRVLQGSARQLMWAFQRWWIWLGQKNQFNLRTPNAGAFHLSINYRILLGASLMTPLNSLDIIACHIMWVDTDRNRSATVEDRHQPSLSLRVDQITATKMIFQSIQPL